MTTKLNFQITDIETDSTFPIKEKVLNVGVVEDVIFLTIMQYTETNKERRLVQLEEVAINKDAFLQGLQACFVADEVDNRESRF